MIRIIQCMTLFITSVVHAQFYTDVEPEPQPWVLKHYFDQKPNSLVKQVSYITTLDLERNLKDDTLAIYFFDSTGEKTREIQYTKNKPVTTYQFHYSGNHISESWSYPANNDRSTQLQVNTYDTNGNKLSMKTFYISKKDTLSRAYQYFKYDEANHLIKKTNNTNNSFISTNDYYYENGNLVKHDFFQALLHVQILYAYNGENLLEEKKEYEVNDTSKTLLTWHYYYYTGKNLTKERYISSFGKPETTVLYEYDDSSRLKQMRVTKDSLYKNVFWEYENGQVKTIKAATNAWNGLHREFYIPLSSISPLTKIPILYEEQYSYDAKGNFIEKRSLLGGELLVTKVNKIEYY